MLTSALQLEVEEYIARYSDLVDENGHRVVVKNGVGKTLTITVGSGSFGLQVSRVDDRRDGERFLSSILPPYLRKSPKIESLLPLLYLKGLSTEDGDKELLAAHPGYRESSESWLVVLRSLIGRGMTAPMLAIGDGALGFWKAVRSCEGFEKTEEQRCWVHKIANVLDKLPKRLQADAKNLLHEMMKANKEEVALNARKSFEKLFSEKYPKSIDCLVKNWDQLITFFKYPAMHLRCVPSKSKASASTGSSSRNL